MIIRTARLTEAEALRNNPRFPCPPEILCVLRVVTLPFFGFDSKIHRGQLVVHMDLIEEVCEIFEVLADSRFPIERMIPIAHPRYAWSDRRSMEDNNTSAFNYRKKVGKIGKKDLSCHAFGRAIDINPLLNPYIRGSVVEPIGARYDPELPGTITEDSIVVRLFVERGYSWGGHWKSLKDYQHFEKPLPAHTP